MVEQAQTDRLERLLRGACPLHGVKMAQEDIELAKPFRFIVFCPRRDCEIKAFQKSAISSAKLFDEFNYLLSEK